jgi:hypothetical protein
MMRQRAAAAAARPAAIPSHPGQSTDGSGAEISLDVVDSPAEGEKKLGGHHRVEICATLQSF